MIKLKNPNAITTYVNVAKKTKTLQRVLRFSEM